MGKKFKEEMLKYWKRQTVKKIVIIAGVVTCLIGGVFALRNRKSAEVTATPVQTTEEAVQSSDLNIPINGEREDSAKSLKELLGGEDIIDMPSNPESVETKGAEEETTIAETMSVETIAESQSAPSPESKKPVQEESSPTPTTQAPKTAPQPTAAPAEIESQVNEIREAPVETMPQAESEAIKGYYEEMLESMLADPEFQDAISNQKDW